MRMYACTSMYINGKRKWVRSVACMRCLLETVVAVTIVVALYTRVCVCVCIASTIKAMTMWHWFEKKRALLYVAYKSVYLTRRRLLGGKLVGCVSLVVAKKVYTCEGGRSE